MLSAGGIRATMRNRHGSIAPSSWADYLAWDAIEHGDLLVDLDSGAITRLGGQRAEYLERRTGYGRVVVSRRPLVIAMAQRVVWMAAFGPIPAGWKVGHVNTRRWDNRLANLELMANAGEGCEHIAPETYPAFLDALVRRDTYGTEVEA